jgi:transposase
MRPHILRDDRWNRIRDNLPGRAGSVGVTAADNRRFVDTVIHRYPTGIPWRDLPAPKKVGEDRAIGRSKGRLSTKIHALVDALGLPWKIVLTAGQVHDLARADAMLPGMEAKA